MNRYEIVKQQNESPQCYEYTEFLPTFSKYIMAGQILKSVSLKCFVDKILMEVIENTTLGKT